MFLKILTPKLERESTMLRKIFKAIGVANLLIVLGMGLQINIAHSSCTCWKIEGDTRTIPGATFCYRHHDWSHTTGGCTGRGGDLCCYSEDGIHDCWVNVNRQWGNDITSDRICKS